MVNFCQNTQNVIIKSNILKFIYKTIQNDLFIFLVTSPIASKK